MAILRWLMKVFSSYALAAILLAFLLLLTWLGTLEQVEHGLFEVQKKYFESIFLVHDFGPVPVPLPGVYLLLSLLTLNLILGGLVRIRWDLRRSGILITHVGILLLFAAGLVKFKYSTEGSLMLWPGEKDDEFMSYHDWELSIREAVPAGRTTEHLIAHTEWAAALDGGAVAFTSDALPFDLTVTRAFRNASVVPQGPMFKGDGPTIDGYTVLRRPLEIEAEQNLAAVYVRTRDKATGQASDGIVWGAQKAPLTVDAGGKSWLVSLRKTRYPLPFTVGLDKFDFAMHPGTMRPKYFRSEVTKYEGERRTPVSISMNEPLRHQGFTLYQASYGPSNAPPEAEHYSVFAVVRNPSDQWPKWACYIIALGMALHFLMKLVRFTKSESTRAAA